VVQSTHRLRFAGGLVEKHYRRWERGEPDREWNTLVLLDGLSPGLAPRPIGRRWADGVPVVVMSELPGVPLGDELLTRQQLEAVATVMSSLWELPVESLSSLPPRIEALPGMFDRVRDWCARIDVPALAGDVAEAFVHGRRWLTSHPVWIHEGGTVGVLSNGDGNLGNYLWDGKCCRLVDFEDAGLSAPAYEIADLLEHVSVSLPGFIDPACFMSLLDLDRERRWQVMQCRRLFAIFWLLMLLPGNPASSRNPVGSLERQVLRVQSLLDDADE
jgi:hypothetical protein